ncbi:hypothetical protein, partial [Herbiconiux sp.]|uniref:hypothetical protein n=1 Tax=Herbiconiux sp. TaxID=1871186 RepID=UPI0025C44CFF
STAYDIGAFLPLRSAAAVVGSQYRGPERPASRNRLDADIARRGVALGFTLGFTSSASGHAHAIWLNCRVRRCLALGAQ